MSFAVVITIKNEARLIRDNVLFHRHMGASAVFVYDDGCTDNSVETLDGIDIVVTRKSITTEELPALPSWASTIDIGYFGAEFRDLTNPNARLCANCLHALHLARERNIEWLIFIDADEFVAPRDQLRQNRLVDFFASVPKDFDVVRFLPLEVLPVSSVVGRAVKECIYFKQFDYFRSNASRSSYMLYDEFTGEEFVQFGLLGDSRGKTAARTSAPVLPCNNHWFSQPFTARELIVGLGVCALIHYFSYDSEDFVKKNSNFSAQADFFRPNVPTTRHKQLWRRMAGDPAIGGAGLRSHFEKWIVNSRDDLDTMALKNGDVVVVSALSALFSELDRVK